MPKLFSTDQQGFRKASEHMWTCLPWLVVDNCTIFSPFYISGWFNTYFKDKTCRKVGKADSFNTSDGVFICSLYMAALMLNTRCTQARQVLHWQVWFLFYARQFLSFATPWELFTRVFVKNILNLLSIKKRNPGSDFSLEIDKSVANTF